MARVYWCLLVACGLALGAAFMHEGFPQPPAAMERNFTCAASDQDLFLSG
ncbi:hypothetical protein BH24PSE2_BH24PSE2_02200 [soil metagenome]